MAETPEIDELAKRYLDLWQEHLSDMAEIREWSASFTRLPAAFLSSVKEGEPTDAVGVEGITESETGATPTVDPSADRGADLREFQRRIAALEGGSPNWKAALDEVILQVAEVNTLELTTAVERESRRRLATFLEGVQAYRIHPYRRRLPEPPAARDGSSRLLEFSGNGTYDRPAIFVVPSLVNRAYVLDLAEGQSFMRWLSANGVDGFLVDWGRPDDAERDFDLTDYIADRLERFFNLVCERSRKPVFVLGYCMGGNLALAMTQRRQREVAGLALLATPWNFHATDKSAALALAATLRAFEPQLHVLVSSH